MLIESSDMVMERREMGDEIREWNGDEEELAQSQFDKILRNLYLLFGNT